MPPIPGLLGRMSPSKICRTLLPLALISLLLAPPSHALRIVSYNVLNVSSTNNASTRVDDHRIVLGAIDADLIVVQEIIGLSGAQYYFNNVLQVIEPGEWSLAPFVNGPDTDNACFYRTSELDYLSMVTLSTALRDINGWVFRPDGYASSEADFRVYSLHLKASTGSDNEQKRLAEATILRNHLNSLPSGTQFFIGGDYNLYESSEPAWGKLTGFEADNDGRVFDPINRVGNWHNNSSFADVHSQSTRSGDIGDGGSSGGMDDRFDFILVNDELQDGSGIDYVPNSYRTFGQDGRHYNQAINVSPTIPEGSTMANALHFASDHLPIVLDAQLPAKLLVNGNLSFGRVLVGSAAQRTLTIQNPASAPADDLEYSGVASAGFTAPGGLRTVSPGFLSVYTVSVSTASAGALNGDLTLSTNAPDNASEVLPASATVLDPSVSSVRSDAVLLSEAADFGSHPLGEFTDLDLEAHNFGYDPQQALLELYDWEISGVDAARFSLVGFAPTEIGAAPASLTLRFDDLGASEGSDYQASLRLLTRDEQAVFGAQDRSDLVFAVSAHVESAVPAPALSRRTQLLANYPNPFNPRTTVAFEIAEATRVRIEVYDLRGRRVALLLDEARDPGRHEVLWNGSDDQGRAVASGVYLYRLRVEGLDETRRMTLVR